VAILQQERHIELVSGTSERFVITSRMTTALIPAELPHLNVFVLRVTDRSDAKHDVFARVARLSDLSLLPAGRDSALQDSGEYLAAGMTLGYATLTEALLAQTAIKDRVNQVIQDWMSFSTKFNAPDPTPANFVLPSSVQAQKTALIMAYKAAKQDRYQKQLAKEAADVVLVRAQAVFTYIQDLVAAVEQLATQAAATQAAFATTGVVYDTLRTAGSAFLAAASCAGAADRNNFQSELNSATNESTSIQGRVASAGTLVAALTTLRDARVTERDAANVSVSAATVDQITKTQALASAEALEQAALQAVRTVCPDFDATSVCRLSG
jgi:hypothetical protein